MRYIAAFHWIAAIDLAFCGVLQRRYINCRNIRVLAALDITIAVLHKLVAIKIPFRSILQWWYIKPPQYISFSGIYVTYSGGLADRRNRYFFAVLFHSYSGNSDHHNRPFSCLGLVQCIPLLLWPKRHFGFSFPSSFYCPMYPSVVSSKKKPTHTLSLYISIFITNPLPLVTTNVLRQHC